MDKKKIFEECEFVIKRLVTKNVLKSNYNRYNPKWELSEYYRKKLPHLSNFDFFLYDKEAYIAERMILNYEKTKEVFNVVCKTDVLFNEVKSLILNSSICWQCGIDVFDDKIYKPIFNNSRTAMCKSCDTRLNNLLSEYKRNVDEHQFYQNNIKRLLNESDSKNSSCYIATLVYQDINHPKVESLRQFRDNILLNFFLGKLFVTKYYEYSPSLVKWLKGKNYIQKCIKGIIDLFLYAIKKIGK